MQLAVPRDRDGSFEPVLVPKQATRRDGLNAVIISLYAKGMSVRDIARHVRQTTGVDLSPDTISRVTDGALEGMREWQPRPLEPFYPVVYIDALVAKVRDGSAVRNKAVNIAVGIDDDGRQARAGHLGRRGGGLWDSHRFVWACSCCCLRLCASGVTCGIHGEALIFQVLP